MTSVLILNDDLATGGVQRIVVDLANELSRRGHTVLIGAAPGTLQNGLAETVVTITLPPKGQRVRRALAVLRLIRRASRSVDVVHSHQRGLALLVQIAVLGKAKKPRLIEHVHNHFESTRLTRLLSFRSPALIACGTSVQEMLVRDFRIPASRITLVVNGTKDLAQPSRPRPAPEAPVIAAVGRLGSQKDPQRFIRVMYQLDLLLPDVPWKARWAGGGPLLAKCEDLVENLNLQHRVRFEDDVARVADFLHDSTALLLTSKHEGLPLAAIEALSCGLPVIVPDVGSCSDLFSLGCVGRLYDSTLSDKELASEVGTLLQQPLDSLSLTARTTYEARFTFDSYVDSIERLYQKC